MSKPRLSDRDLKRLLKTPVFDNGDDGPEVGVIELTVLKAIVEELLQWRDAHDNSTAEGEVSIPKGTKVLLVPPNLSRCQAEKPGNGPFTIGGEIGNPKRGYRVRCKAKPTVIATEKKPGKDGQHGSMSLCDGCKEAMIKQRGEDFATFVPISERASSAK